MTNNIEKMYELAEVEKLNKVSIHLNKAYNFEFHETDTKSDFYPPFTDTKQLELIKWLASEQNDVEISWYSDIGFRINNFLDSCEHKDFSQALAGLVCELWEDLSDEQKQEIKRILE